VFLVLRLAAVAVLTLGIPAVVSVSGLRVRSLCGGSGKDVSSYEKGGDSSDIL